MHTFAVRRSDSRLAPVAKLFWSRGGINALPLLGGGTGHAIFLWLTRPTPHSGKYTAPTKVNKTRLHAPWTFDQVQRIQSNRDKLLQTNFHFQVKPACADCNPTKSLLQTNAPDERTTTQWKTSSLFHGAINFRKPQGTIWTEIQTHGVCMWQMGNGWPPC